MPGSLHKDLLASIVVFLVALPLAMGISIASGMPPAAGLVTCIVGGVLVGCISGNALQVSGPAAGLSVIVYEIIQEHGIARLGIVVLIAGIFQMVAGLARTGQWFRAVSPAVVNGMLSGIGVLILASQFHVTLDDAPRSSGIGNLVAIPEAFFKCFNTADGTNSHVPGLLGVFTILIILLWESLPFKKLKVIPSALIAVVIATVAASIMRLDINHVTLPDNLFSALSMPKDWRDITNWNLILEGLGLGFVASAETLLSASAVDRMQTMVRTKYDKELFAQGVGNVLCGWVGALPMTGVIVRSSVNIQAGAQTRLSAILHGCWILILVLCCPFVLRYVPTSALAALLVYTGYKLTNFKIIKELRKYGNSEAAIYLITLCAIVCTDLLTGVLTGVVLSVLKLLYIFSHLEIKQTAPFPEKTELYLKGAATFLNLPRLAEALDAVPASHELHVHLEDLDYVDHASLDMIMSWEQSHKANGGALVIDWGTLGAMFRDRRRGAREAAQAQLGLNVMELEENLVNIAKQPLDALEAALEPSHDGATSATATAPVAENLNPPQSAN